MEPLIATALQHVRDGNDSAAAQACERILATNRKHPDALHLLGKLRLRSGAVQDAVDLISRAVSLRSDADFYLDLAEAYRAAGQAQRAAICCQTALRLRPDNPAGLNTLGLSLMDLGQLSEAADAFQQAIALRQDFAAAHNNLGVVRMTLGQTDQALDHFRRAVDLAPDFIPARANLGRLLFNRGQLEEALPHSEAAARMYPTAADPQTDLASIFWAMGRVQEAISGYQKAIALAPNRPVPRANLGRLLRDEGRPVEAVAHLTAAAKLDSENATYWDELAELHWEMEAAPDAIACWQRALEIWDRTESQAPGRAVARNSLGWALQEEGRLAEAAECYQAALRLNPDLAPAHLNHGVLHEEKGEMAEAEAAYRTAIRLQPTYPLAHSRLATLLRGKLPEADLSAMEACLASPILDDSPRARLLFAVAHVADAQGDPARAADCLRRANALNLAANRRRMRLYDPAEHDLFVDGLISGFNRAWFARVADAGSPSRRPVFVLGLPRSGTTLVEQVLASHPAVHGAGELTLARRGFESLPAVLGQSGPSLRCLPDLSSSTIRGFAEEHLKQLQQLAPARAERVVDKMPENYLYLGWIATLFPNATIIHCQRDLRDIALSCWMTDFRTLRWTSDPASIASRFRAYLRLMKHWQETCPLSIHSIRYEETVADLETVARRLIAACGLEWHPACLEFHQTKRTVRTASVTQVRQPLYSTSVARWKRYEQELAGLFVLLPLDEAPPEHVS